MQRARSSKASGRLVRLMISNWVLGWAVGLTCAALVLASNIGGIRELLLHSDVMLQGLALLFGGFGFSFGGVVCATAVMLLPVEEETETDGGGLAAPVLLPAYVLARARAPRC